MFYDSWKMYCVTARHYFIFCFPNYLSNGFGAHPTLQQSDAYLKIASRYRDWNSGSTVAMRKLFM
jgi:hypothetical protein